MRQRAAVHAALNGDRDHPATPRAPQRLAAEARAAVRAGARLLHLHAYDGLGGETLGARPCADAVRAVRAACPHTPISLTTSAGIEPDPEHRLELVAEWTALPELATANWGEDGVLDLCELLQRRDIGIEAGLLSAADARAFVAAGIAPRCVRVLVEPLGADPAEALAEAGVIETVLAEAGIGLEQVHHGDGIASWAVSRRGAELGHSIRTGLEDTPVLPDGSQARGNGELVAAAVQLLERSRAL